MARNGHTNPPQLQDTTVLAEQTHQPSSSGLPIPHSPTFSIANKPISGILPQYADEHIPVPPEQAAEESSYVWFDQSQYDQVVEGKYIQYIHRTAGHIQVKNISSWEKVLKTQQETNPSLPWHLFKSESEWRLGYWLATSKSSQSKIDEFLDMDGILAEPTSFN
ncbi:hypothetical protein FRC11_011821 [Ceratobasidium sp. 423]|nr:hypothetical protein FRC11_011821 [Ceratobasidium sp. 423]